MDILFYNVNVQDPVTGLISMLLLIPGLYPGANILAEHSPMNRITRLVPAD